MRRPDRPPVGLPETVPLHSETAEANCLGAALVNRKSAEQLIDLLRWDDFYLIAHQVIFQAIEFLVNDNQPSSPDIVMELLRDRGKLDEIGGYAYLLKLANEVESAALVEYYAEPIREKAVMRKITELTAEYLERAREGRDKASSLLTGLSNQIESLQERRASKRLKVYTAPELGALDLPPLQWIVPNYIPQGLILVHSKPKVGKTRMTDSLGIAVASGGLFLGKIPVNPSEVFLFYLEDSLRSCRTRLLAACGGSPLPPALSYTFECPTADEGGLREIYRELKARPNCKLMVIDTLQIIRPSRKENGDIYADDVKFVRHLKRIADEFNICLMVLHHSKKGGDSDDLIDGASGTAGITGSVDAIFRLRQKIGSEDAILEGRGREVFEFQLAARLDKLTGWQLLGDARELERTQQETEVLDYIGDRAVQPSDIVKPLGLSRSAAQMRLKRMAERGILKRSEGGVYWRNPDYKTGVDGVRPVDGVDEDKKFVDGVRPVDGVDSYDKTVADTGPFCHNRQHRQHPSTPPPVDALLGTNRDSPRAYGPLASTPSTPLDIGPKNANVDGVIPVDGVDEVDLENKEWEVLYRLAKAANFPRVLAAGLVCDPGEENWIHAAKRWHAGFAAEAKKILETLSLNETPTPEKE